jgi:hypothetical protein
LLSGFEVRGERELARAATVDSRAFEVDDLSRASVPLVHLSDIVYTGALLAREVARCKWGTVEGSLAERNGVFDDHVCRDTGDERQEEGSLGEHVDA